MDELQRTEDNRSIPLLSNLELTLDQYPSIKELSMTMGIEEIFPDRSLHHLQHILPRKCPHLRKLAVVYQTHCVPGNFVDQVAAILGFDRVVAFQFKRRVESPPIMGFVGNYDLPEEQRGTGQPQRNLVWIESLGPNTNVTLVGANCVCRDPEEKCLVPCHTLAAFLIKTRNKYFPEETH